VIRVPYLQADRRMARRALAAGVAALTALSLVLVATPETPAEATPATKQIVDITFPVRDTQGRTSYTDDYYGARSRGDHGATDIGGPNAYGIPVHAAVGGRITLINGTDGRSLPAWGYAIYIAGDDGRSYRYLHLGRQNGPASEAYAPGMKHDLRIERGQHIGYIGHSGNASATWPHLHFEIDDKNVVDRQGTNRINPYYSLRDAQRRGDLPGSVKQTAPPPEPVAGFGDVHVGHAHEDGIRAVAEAKVTVGCGSGSNFCPEHAVNRGQMATFLMRAFRLPAAGAPTFGDVPADHPHAEGIAAVQAAGIAEGRGDGRYDPEASVRRDQMASYLANALELSDRSHGFTDVPRDSVHGGAIGAIAHRGITTGINGGTRYDPSGDVTRAQMATFLMRAAGL
jgi:hypothetical protein